jgi:hypothetical protein
MAQIEIKEKIEPSASPLISSFLFRNPLKFAFGDVAR